MRRQASSVRSRQLRHEHRVLGAEWLRAARDSGHEGLVGLSRQLLAHLDEEARAVHPLVRRHLPEAAGTLETVRAEQATFQSLVELLCARLTSGSRGEDVSAIVHDIEQLWRAHVRRFDRVIGPLLRRLDAGEVPS